MPETTATPDASDAGAVAQARASQSALNDAIKEAQGAWPEDEDQDDLGTDDVSADPDEDDSPADTRGNSDDVAELRETVAELRAELAELRKSRTSTEDDVEAADDPDELPEGWEGLSPYAKRQHEKMQRMKAELSVKQERLDATVSLIAFKQDFPDYKKYEGQITQLLKSEKFNTGAYYEDLVTIYEHVTGQEAKKELARSRSTQQARAQAGALGREKPVRPGAEPAKVSKLPTFGEAYNNAVRSTIAKQSGRRR